MGVDVEVDVGVEEGVGVGDGVEVGVGEGVGVGGRAVNIPCSVWFAFMVKVYGLVEPMLTPSSSQ